MPVSFALLHHPKLAERRLVVKVSRSCDKSAWSAVFVHLSHRGQKPLSKPSNGFQQLVPIHDVFLRSQNCCCFDMVTGRWRSISSIN